MTRMLGTILAAAVLAAGVASTARAEGPIKTRKENQQARIAQGVKSGSLTPRETAHLERREAALNREIHHDRVANGGNLTNKEKAQVNRQQNRISKSIYQQKHDGQTQH